MLRSLVVGVCAIWVVACGSDDSSSNKPGTGGSGGTGASSTGGSTSGGAGGVGATGGGGAAGSGGSAAGPSGACPAGIVSDPDVKQALPQSYVDTTPVAPSGQTIAVAAGGDVQAALDQAQPGDVITLEAGATFTGSFTLPKKTGNDYITIRSSAPDSALPPAGTRVDPSYAAQLAKIVLPGDTGPAIGCAAGAHHYRLIGLEVTPASGTYVHRLIEVGSGESSDADLPHDVIVDRCFIHGDPAKGTRRGVQANGKSVAIIDSYISDIKEDGADSQAIGGWNGPGPFKIVNNHLEGAGENLMFGGAPPALAGVIPSDIEFCHNHVVKPLSWKSESWTVKNSFELKNAQRLLVAGNVFENNWAAAQVGFAIVLTPRGEGGAAPQATVSDLTFVYNVIRHTASAINMAGDDDSGPSGQTSRLVFAHNLLMDVDSNAWGGAGRLFQVITSNKPVLGVKFEHNTAAIAGNAFLVMGDTVAVATGLVFRDNLVPHGDYGAFGSGKGEGTGALDAFAPGAVFTKNVIFGGGTASSYPAGNVFPATASDVGFTDFAGGDLSLSAQSSLKGTASDGSDPGADLAKLSAATAGVAP